MTPILLVTGFLGAGKTTLVNHLLTHAHGTRFAAIVNDFGAINIDAELLAGATAEDGPEAGIVSLANGCICCSLEGDLLRTLATLLRRTPRPDRILIETSGIADPNDIVRTLMDPVIWREAPLETVLCALDATQPPSALSDPLLQAQLKAADIIALTKTDLAPPTPGLEAALQSLRPTATRIEAPNGDIPHLLLFPGDPAPPHPRPTTRRRPTVDRFESLSWTSDHPIDLGRLQAAITRLAPTLARAKGLFEPAGQPGQQMLFQLAGGRATLATLPGPPTLPKSRIVAIAELGRLDPETLKTTLDACTTP